MIYKRLLKLKNKLRKSLSADELLVEKNYGRVMTILWKRYNYGMAKENEEHSDDMEEYRYGDFRDEIMAIEKTRRVT